MVRTHYSASVFLYAQSGDTAVEFFTVFPGGEAFWGPLGKTTGRKRLSFHKRPYATKLAQLTKLLRASVHL